MKLFITDQPAAELFQREGFYYKEKLADPFGRIKFLSAKSSEVVCDFRRMESRYLIQANAPDIHVQFAGLDDQVQEGDAVIHIEYDGKDVSSWSLVLHSRFAERLDYYISRCVPNATEELFS